ncbi:MAG: nucleotidyltransferase domain-containing protein [Sulfurovum sp.]|nr:nucleotidyltransferase domain-containing protein [Sulfurovum sp.]
MNKKIILEQLRDFYINHAQQYHLKKLGLFGSVARGEATDASDIDIVVEFDQPNLLTQAALMLKLKELFKKDVDVVALWEKMNPRLRSRIESDVIYV